MSHVLRVIPRGAYLHAVATGETLAANRGLNVRVFTDRQEAERWLSA